jgi:CopG family transcriptional regulator, nickel-responsive regulator
VTRIRDVSGTMERVTRFGVSLPASLVDRFDKHIRELGYDNRSKAIHDAVTDFITQSTLTGGMEFIGTISYVYDHHAGDVTHRLTELQHDHDRVIKSTMHAHITHDLCVEVMIVEGKAEEIQKLYGSISSSRGVENCKIATLMKK